MSHVSHLHGAATRSRGQVVFLTLLFLLSLLLQYATFSGPAIVLAAHNEGIFELDGNALDNTDATFPNDADWQNGPEGASDSFFVGAASEAEANDSTYLQTGNSKDENDVSSWVISTTGAPDKNELLDAYSAVYQQSGNTWVYFGADRFDNDGTAQIGFWFFQDKLAIVNGAFTGGHQDGDVLIISEYTNGGVVSTICAYTWDSSGGGANVADPGSCDKATKTSNLNLVAAGSACDVADGTFDICAVSNKNDTTAPWTFENKDGHTDFGPGQFFEGGLNLSDMFGGNAPCFGTFLAETRTSAETDAQLKDIAFGSFDTCVPPDITTDSSSSTADFGQTVSDTANLSGANGAVTGSVDFFICGPTEVTAGGCEGSAGTKVGATKPISSGSATSDNYTVGLTSAAAGTYCWRAEYTPDDGSNYQAGSHTNASSECFEVAPATIAIDKVANPVGPVQVGGDIGFDIVVTNTGDGTALGVSATDNLPAGIVWTADSPTGDTTGVSCSINTAPNPDVLTCTDASMAAGDSFTVHIHGTTDAGDCGTVNNSATVTTTNDGSDTDPASVLVACPSLTIDKVATESGFDSVGDVIHYTITATNNGNVPLLNVVVTDAQVSNLDCTPATPVASLAVGASITCTASHTITLADLDAGTFYNQACTDDGNGDGLPGADPVCDDVSTPGTQNPSLTIDKVDNTGSYDSVGDVISYTITATNNGNVTLHDVVVTDAQVSDLDCTPATPVADLAPGASITCTASHTIVQADLDAGSFYNQACTDDGNGDGATGADAACDDVTTPGTQSPALSIDKVATESGFDSVGDVIHYTITATNTGNVTLHDVVVTDAQVSTLDCTPATPVADLAPGASITCTASHTIVQADLDAGSFYNQACTDDGNGDGATGADPICDDVTTPGDQNPALSIEKVDNTGSFDSVGDVINYSITATNTGNVTLHDVVVTDAQVSDLDCAPATPVADLAPGGTITCTASHTITQDDIDAGSFWNQACTDDGNGNGEAGAAPVCDDVTTPGSKNPHLAIDKVATESGFDSVGDVIHYTITATNDGNVTLHDVVVTDAQVSDLDCTPATPVADLAVGASITCTASHTITQEDLDAGSFYNQACVDDGDGGAESQCDDVTTPGDQNPSLAIDKVATEDGFDSVGDVIHYTITATNDGNVTLHNVVVTDAQVSDLDCTPDTPVADLAPGASITCTASHTITQGDLDAGSFYNQACTDDGNGDGETGAAAICDDVTTPGDQNPTIGITKESAEPGFDAVGDVIHYLITITNTGNVTLHDVIVTDDQVSDLDCTPDTPVPTLAPGASFTCTASHTVTQADLDALIYFNQACTDDENGALETGAAPACDDVTVFGQKVEGFTPPPTFTQPPTDGPEGGSTSRPADFVWYAVLSLMGALAALVVLSPARGRRRP